MPHALLHVLQVTLHGAAQIPSILRALRHAGAGASCVLLLCDLEDANAAVLPREASMLQKLQSGVMAQHARSGAGHLLLVRKRAWDDAQRAYLGCGQRQTGCEVLAQLLAGRKPQAAFEISTVSPDSLCGRFSHVLFSDLSLACTPDTPERMIKALERAGGGCVCAQTLYRQDYPQSALARLCRCAPFSLSPLLAARELRLLRRGDGTAGAPVLLDVGSLLSCGGRLPASIPLSNGCFFVRRQSVTLSDFFALHRRQCFIGSSLHALLPIVQLLLLFASALWGVPLAAALAILPSELWCFLHLRLLPGALLRLSLLPLTALISLDALLCRALARSRLLRLRVPDALISPQGCALFGAALLPVALHGAQALVCLLPVCLLWLAAPLLIPSMDAPTLERIPLGSDQLKQLRALGCSAFWESKDGTAALRMLACCAGCMLGLLEPDEAARQAEALLGALPDAPLAPVDHAALLASAQFFRERMGDCDAALRELPAQIERRALALPLRSSTSRLGALLRAARGEISAAQALERMAQSSPPEPHDLLFLPMESTRRTPVYPLSLPLTHPHTFLRRQLSAPGTSAPLAGTTARFLFLAAAALGHPFYPLLTRSPAAGPYMPLLCI